MKCAHEWVMSFGLSKKADEEIHRAPYYIQIHLLMDIGFLSCLLGIQIFHRPSIIYNLVTTVHVS